MSATLIGIKQDETMSLLEITIIKPKVSFDDKIEKDIFKKKKNYKVKSEQYFCFGPELSNEISWTEVSVRLKDKSATKPELQ